LSLEGYVWGWGRGGCWLIVAFLTKNFEFFFAKFTFFWDFHKSEVKFPNFQFKKLNHEIISFNLLAVL
jgi:hypothetical protein